MRELQPIAAKVPYMVCPGNHEFNFNFTAFTHRFNGMPVSHCLYEGSAHVLFHPL
jgi:hypothetical protein